MRIVRRGNEAKSNRGEVVGREEGRRGGQNIGRRGSEGKEIGEEGWRMEGEIMQVVELLCIHDDFVVNLVKKEARLLN